MFKYGKIFKTLCYVYQAIDRVLISTERVQLHIYICMHTYIQIKENERKLTYFTLYLFHIIIGLNFYIRSIFIYDICT